MDYNLKQLFVEFVFCLIVICGLCLLTYLCYIWAIEVYKNMGGF
jgi:hypothetical protein